MMPTKHSAELRELKLELLGRFTKAGNQQIKVREHDGKQFVSVDWLAVVDEALDYTAAQVAAVVRQSCEQCKSSTSGHCSIHPVSITFLVPCNHNWYKCEPETDDIEHCSNCGAHRHPSTHLTTEQKEKR